MQPTAEDKFDVSSFLTQGARDYQEDAISTEFKAGSDLGLVVLADGMGGHAAGDVASKIVVEEVFTRLSKEMEDVQSFIRDSQPKMEAAAIAANDALKAYGDENPEVRGMGATLVSAIVLHNLLYWISIGDSPLFLYRNNELQQLNEDHSMAPQIDFLVKSGLMDPEVGATHPDRSVLTAVLIGDPLDKIDCPTVPFRLEKDDLLIVSSDGLQYLSDAQIKQVLLSCGDAPAEEITEALGAAIDDLDDPEQDNASFAVIRIGDVGGDQETYEIAWDFEEEEEVANSDEDANIFFQSAAGNAG